MPTEAETRAKLRKFIEQCVKHDLEAEGEHAIDKWADYFEDKENPGITDIYKLTAADRDAIKVLIAEYRQTREHEENEREQRRLAEERADEVLANHYADRIRKIVLSKPNKFFPKPKPTPPARRKTH